MIRILLVDNHPVVREGLTAVLSAEPDLDIVGEAESGEGALVEAALHFPDVIVMDIRLPGITGIDACRSLLLHHPKTRVVILTTYPNEGGISRAFAAGASAFVLKRSDLVELRNAIRAVVRGEQYVDPALPPKLIGLTHAEGRLKGPFGLTIMEMRVLEKLPFGMTNADIGGALGITENTVKTHLRNAMFKLKAKDRAHAAAIAIREGLA